MGFQLPNAPNFSFLANVDPVASAIQAYQQMNQARGQNLSNQAAQIQNQYLQPQLAAKLQQIQLANKQSQAVLPYAGPQAQATLAQTQAQTPYIQSQTALNTVKGKYPQLFAKNQNITTIPTSQGIVSYNKLTGQTTMLTDPQGRPYMSPTRNGISVTSPDGTITSIGGSAPVLGSNQQGSQQGVQQAPSLAAAISNQMPPQLTHQQQIAPGVNAQASAPQRGIDYNSLMSGGLGQQLGQPGGASSSAGNGPGVITNPTAPQSRYSTGGRTMTDLNTGNSFSIANDKIVGQVQQSLANEGIVSPEMSQMFSNVAGLSGNKNLANRLVGKLGANIGITDPKYASYVAGTKVDPTLIAEAMQKEFALNGTHANLDTLTKMIHLDPKDPPAVSAKKLGDVYASVYLRTGAYRKLLKGGISLQGDLDTSKIGNVISNYYADKLLADNGMKPIYGSNVSAGKSQTLRVRHPDGRTGTIPATDKDNAIAQGYTVIQ